VTMSIRTLMRDVRWLAPDVMWLVAIAAAFAALGIFVGSCIRGRGGDRGDGHPDAYILVREDRATVLWDYQQLPMKDCAWCHRTVNLNRHHIVPQAANPALRDVRDNLIVLCRDCHFVLGHRCDWKRYNPDVLYICTHFTNCVRSADTRYGVTNNTPRTGQPVQVPAYTNINQEGILHVTNDVPDSMRSALERILRDEH